MLSSYNPIESSPRQSLVFTSVLRSVRLNTTFSRTEICFIEILANTTRTHRRSHQNETFCFSLCCVGLRSAYIRLDIGVFCHGTLPIPVRLYASFIGPHLRCGSKKLGNRYRQHDRANIADCGKRLSADCLLCMDTHMHTHKINSMLK